MAIKTLQIRIDENLHTDFKTICAQLGTDMSVQIQSFMIGFIAKHGDKLPVPTKK